MTAKISERQPSVQSAKEDLQSFGFVVVEMVRDACCDTSSLEVSMNETLGRTSKLVTALSKSMGPRRGDSKHRLCRHLAHAGCQVK